MDAKQERAGIDYGIKKKISKEKNITAGYT